MQSRGDPLPPADRTGTLVACLPAYDLSQGRERLEDMAGLPAITRALVRRGHPDETIVKILGGNLLRVFEEVWKR